MGKGQATGGAAEPQYSGAMTSVWWDVDSCPVPTDCDCGLIVRNIRNALAKMNYCGRVTMFAYGDVTRIPVSDQRVLHTKISLRFVGDGYTAEKMIFDMNWWTRKHPAPANYLIISGDGFYSSALNELRSLNYNILVAHPDGAPADLVATASCVWHLRSLVHGATPYRICISNQPQRAHLECRPGMAASECSSDSLKLMVEGNAMTSVWWDIDSCPVPTDCDCSLIVKNIRIALAKMKCCGRITIFAYGDVTRIPVSDQRVLHTKISLRFVGDAGYTAEKMISDMKWWTRKHPAPANYLLISGDGVYSSALDELRSLNYNILVAHPDGALADLVATASCVWHLRSLVRGALPYRIGISKTETVQTPPTYTNAATVNAAPNDVWGSQKCGPRKASLGPFSSGSSALTASE